MSALRPRLALLLVVALAAACGRDDPGSAAPAAAAKVVRGTVSKGPLQGATVDFFNLDIAGDKVGTTPLATVSTDSAGGFSVTGLPTGVPILAVTSGGSYVDESDPETNPSLRRQIAFSSSEHLEAVLPAGAGSIAITPYSMALLQKARTQAAGANFANVYAAVHLQAQSAFGFDPILDIPADPLTGTGGSQAYGLLLGAAAMTINRIAGTGTPEHMPGYLDVIAFIDDFAAPPLDAADLDEMIRLFRNNNIGVYGDVAAPTVDEAALAQPAPVANSAPTISAIADQSTAEETQIVVGVTVGDAEDPSGNSLTVTATADDTALIPTIGVTGTGTSRSVTLTPGADLNGTAVITVVVTDADAGTASDSFQLDVTVVNDAPVVDDQDFATLPENSANATVVGTVAYTDPEGGAQVHSIVAGNAAGAFSINSVTGVVSVANSAALDFETTPSFTLTVQVQDSGGLSDTALVTIPLSSVNDPPVVNDQGLSVAENSSNGTVVGTVASSDPDAGDTRAHSILAGNTGGAFAINGSTGQVTVANAAALNFETTPSFNLTVQVQDAGGASDTALVTVALTNVNEAPVVSDQGLPSVAENSANATVVGTVVSTDPDAGDTRSYSITGGNTGGAFAIGATSGQVTVANSAALNFETTPSFTLTVQVTDAGSLSDTALVTIALTNANEAPVVSDQGLPSVAENSANATVVGSVVSSDPDAGDTRTYAITGGNTGGAFAIGPTSGQVTVANSAALDFEATPSFTLTVQVTDGGSLSDTALVTVAVSDVDEAPVAGNDSISLGEGGSTSTLVGGATSVLANDTDPENDPLSAAVVTGPAHAAVFTLNPDGSFTYLHDGSETTTDSFTYQAADGALLSNVATVAISIAPVNDAPVAVDDAAATTEDTPVNIADSSLLANDVDADGPSLSLAGVGNAVNGGVLLAGSTITFTPDPDFVGAASFEYTVSDGSATDVGVVTVTVGGANDPPTAAADGPYFAQHDQTLSVGAPGVLGNDTDPDLEPLTASLLTAPGNGSISLNPDGSFDYTPSGGYTGPDSFTYEACDAASACASATVTLSVVNAAPVANDDLYSVQHDSTLTVPAITGVLANDSDADPADTLSAVLTVAPANGSVLLSADGSFDYVPSGGFTGTDSFTYEAEDGDNNTIVTATVTINVVNGAPVANDDIYSVHHDTLLTIDAASGVLTNDNEPDAGDVLSAVLVSAPANGSILLNADGSFDYTPSGGFSGTDSFTYEADDGDINTTSVATVTINVTNSAPNATDDSYGMAHDTTLTVDAGSGVLGNDNDPDPADTLSAVLVSAPANGSILLSVDGSFEYTPSGGFSGTDSFTYEADDGDNNTTVTATVTINVSNGAPQAFDDGCTLPPCPAPLPSGTLAWYPANGDATDATGQYDATTIGSISFPGSQVGPGFAFNGVDTGVALAPGSLVLDEQEFSFDLWINPAATQNPYAVIVDNNHTNSTNWVIQQNASNTNQYIWGANDGSGGITFNLQANTWQHLALTRKANVARIYVNGIQVGSASGGPMPIGNAGTVNGFGAGGVPELHLGQYKVNDGIGGFRRWNGLMDEVQVFDRGLSAAEVKALYDAGITGTGNSSFQVGATLPPSLEAWYRGQGDANDAASTNEAALFGGAGFAPGTVGGAFAFDGVDDEAVTSPRAWGFTTSATIAAWINTTDDSGTVLSLAHGDALDELLLHVDNGKIAIFNHKSGNNYTVRASASAVNTGAWVFVAGVIDGGMNNLRVYVNGVEEAGTFSTVGSPSNIADATPRELRVGNRNHAIPTDFFAGLVDEAQLYSRALSPTEIRELYLAGAAGIRAVPGAFEVIEDGTLSGTVAAMLLNDTDVDPDPMATSLNAYFGGGGLSLNGDGTFDYTPAAGFTGTDTFTYVLHDGVAFSSPATVYLTVKPVNDAPSGVDNSVSFDEDGLYTFVPGEFGFSDPDDTPANAFAAVRIAQLPGNGTLFRGATPLSVGDFVSFSDINLGLLTFQPVADHNGPANPDFLFQVQDDGGTANGGVDLDPVARTMAIFVNPVNDPPAGAVVINGTIEEGQLVSADATGVTDNDGLGTFSYQWNRDGVAVPGATAQTYLLDDPEVGALMSVTVDYTDAQGNAESLTSADYGPVTNLNDAPLGSVDITGTAAENETLAASDSLTDGDGLGAITYEWFRGGVGTGVFGSLYALTDADVGFAMTVVASYTDAHGTPEAVSSAATAPVTNVDDAPLGQPAILGTEQEDETLTADTGGISDEDGLGAFSYQWNRDGSPIGGATSDTYVLGDADVTTLITVTVSYTDGHGNAESVLRVLAGGAARASARRCSPAP